MTAARCRGRRDYKRHGRERGTVFADSEGAARAAYGVRSDQDVLLAIRPDGYVGLAADADDAAADRATKYLAQIMADN